MAKNKISSIKIQNPEIKLKNAISNGYALNKFREMVKAHGGDLDSINDFSINKPKFIELVYAEKNGYITNMDTLSLGMVIVYLGGGRLKKTDQLDPSVGISFYKKTGDYVEKGETLLKIFCSDLDKLKLGIEKVKGSIQIEENKEINHQLILS